MAAVGVIFGGPSPEHDVSILTGLQAAHELARGSTHTVRGLFWSKTGEWFEVHPGLEAGDFLEGIPKGASRLHLVLGPGGGFVSQGRVGRPRPLDLDVVLVCCHGGPGEDGSIQGALELAGIPQAGPTVAGAALGMDKLAFGSLVAAMGFPTLPRVLLTNTTEQVAFGGPYIVKPRYGGSSIGIEVVEDVATAVALRRSNMHLSDGAVIEPYRSELFDLQVAARSWPQLEISAVERPLKRSHVERLDTNTEILGYRDKYAGGEGMAGAPRELPARVPAALLDQIHEIARITAVVCDLRGVMRIDFLSDGNQIWINEVNTIPGSLARYLWIDPPVRFNALLDDLLSEARERRVRAMSAAGADGSILHGASSIAAKLA